MYVLLTKENCINCKNAEKFIKNNNLKIEFGEAEEDFIDILRQNGIRSYPILIEDNKTEGFIILENGEKVGYYLAENIEKFKK